MNGSTATTDAKTGGTRPDRVPLTILGAGIAGLAAAAAFARRGHHVTVIEQAAALTDVGAGVQIAPNGARVLDALGVDVPHVPGEAVLLIDGPRGTPLIRMPLRDPFRLVHRADLVDALARAARAAGATVILDAPVTDVADGSLRLASGSALGFDALVGADGARGRTRAFVAPDHAPRFTGQVAWRALVPWDGMWVPESQVHVGPGRHLVVYPLREGRFLNVVAVEEREAWTAASWSQEDDPDALRAAFAGFSDLARGLLDRVDRVHLWGLVDHGATSRWRRGGVTLIGDAAHPTLPFLAQGANLALEDAWTLAARFPDVAGWEKARRPRVARALREAAANARNYHLGGAKRTVAHMALRAVGAVAPGAMMRRYRWLYDHDPVKRSR